MKLSIIIPCYNLKDKISTCLDSIYNSTASKEDYEVILFDSSDDGTEKILENYVLDHGLKVIHSHQKTPIGPARNVAVSYATGDYVYCVDGDDWLYDKDALKHMIDSIGDKDIYFVPYKLLRENKEIKLQPKTLMDMANCPVGQWTKVFRRQYWTPQPPYHPEDVVSHFMTIDKCSSVGYLDHVVYVYDNRTENSGAISRTYDFCLNHHCNLADLAVNDRIKNINLKEEYVAGVIHNLGDMFIHRNNIKNPDVKKSMISRFIREFTNFQSGIYVH